MAKNKGIFPLSGTLGNVTFAETKHGNIAKTKTSINRERVLEDPAFERSRQASAEFGVVSSAGKLLRKAFGGTAGFARKWDTHNNLNKLLLMIKHEDKEHEQGARGLLPKYLKLLKGFEWNKAHPMSTVFMGNYKITIDHEQGMLTILFPNLNPGEHIVAPKGTTHYQLKAAIATLDLGQSELPFSQAYSDQLPYKEMTAEPMELSMPLPGGKDDQYCICLGVCFHEKFGQLFSPLRGGSAFAIAEVTDPKS